MNICIAETDAEITACFPIMRELRPYIPEEEFVPRIRHQQKDGYRLAFIKDGNTVVAVAGFRIGENLAWGRFLYVDDLVTSVNHRSNGYGANLLIWLREYAQNEGCQQMHLDSGMHREDAHRFYVREGMSKAGIHFVYDLMPGNGN